MPDATVLEAEAIDFGLRLFLAASLLHQTGEEDMTDEQLAELEALAEKATEGPWRYRPNKFDDWGVVRAPSEYFVLQAKAGRHLTDEEVADHFARKTDPYAANALFAVASRTAMPSLIAEVRRLRALVADRAAVVEECAVAAELAELPAHFQWGDDAMEQFNFGKKRAAIAIRALATPQEKDHG